MMYTLLDLIKDVYPLRTCRLNLEEKAIKKAAEQKERDKREKKVSKSYSRRSTRQNPIVKVLTSATFIRAVFGILKKVLK